MEVKGRVVLESGEAVAGASVTIRTGKDEVDFPETVARLGGPGPLAELRNPVFGSELEERVEEVGGWTPAHRSTTDPEGSFAISVPRGLPEFWFAVEADLAAYPIGDRYTLGSPSLRDGVLLRLVPAGQAEGVLRTADGRVSGGGFVFAVAQEAHRMIPPPVRADASGRYVIRGLGGSRYDFVAAGPGGAPAARKDVEVPMGSVTRVDLDLPPEASIAGRVVDGEGDGIAGAWVTAMGGAELLPGVYPWNLTRVRYGRARTDRSGGFRVASLLGGTHHLMVEAEGFAVLSSRRVDLPAGSGVDGLVLALEAGRSISGRVLDADRRAVAGVLVTAVTDPRENERRSVKPVHWSRQRTRTEVDGAFRVSGLGDGWFIVQARREGRVLAERKGIEAGGAPVELVVGCATGIAGNLRSEAERPPPTEFRIEARRVQLPPVGTPSARRYAWKAAERSFRSGEGSFEWLDMEPGLYDL
ncbi:MAG: carboxypeptidase-like regulatory domain-containing protein, partial [Planctomycetota bacterium]